MNTGISGKTALITAATKGIGLSTVEALLEEGCSVYLSSSNEQNVLSVLEELMVKYPGKVAGSVCDLSLPESVVGLYHSAKSTFGGISILINNCGGPKPGLFGEFTKSEWDSAHNQILLNAATLIELTLPDMKKQEWGRIVNITSISVKQPADNLLLSNIYRAGLTALAKTLAPQIAPFGITINNVAPGYTLTGRIKELAEKVANLKNISVEAAMKEMIFNIPTQRMATPQEIAAGVVYFVSVQAAYTTGQTLLIDGGLVRAY